jgi:tight adherence protein B
VISFVGFHPFAFALVIALIVALILRTRFRGVTSNEERTATISQQGPGAREGTNSSETSLLDRALKGLAANSLGLGVMGTFLGSLVLLSALLRSVVVALPISILTSSAPLLWQRRKAERFKKSLEELWPELIDLMISGLRSGLSLAETIAALGRRGPEATKKVFQDFEIQLRSGTEFSIAMRDVKRHFSDPLADQVCEVLIFAKGSGSRDTALTLRALSDLIRRDLEIRDEISAKHGWIKNSALLASVAPWLLLVVLSTQPSTLRAYSSATGFAILLLGVLLTAIAYLWMNRVGRLRQTPRVFAS